MNKTKSSHFVSTSLAFTALACLIVVTLIVVVTGAVTPNYSHLSQFISELGAEGAPYSSIVRYAGFLPAGLLLLAFSFLAYRVLPRSRSVTLSLIGLAIYAAGYLVAAAFPCDPGCRPSEPSTSQLIHNAGGLAGYLLSPLFLFALARAVRDWPKGKRLSVAGYIASAFALAGVLTLSPTSDFAGLSQRILEGAVLGWIAMLGVAAARRNTAEVEA